MDAFVLDENGVFLVNVWHRGTTVNSNSCTEMLRSVNAHLFIECPTRNISEMLLLHNSARPHAIVCTTGAITDFL